MTSKMGKSWRYEVIKHLQVVSIIMLKNLKLYILLESMLDYRIMRHIC